MRSGQCRRIACTLGTRIRRQNKQDKIYNLYLLNVYMTMEFDNLVPIVENFVLKTPVGTYTQDMFRSVQTYNTFADDSTTTTITVVAQPKMDNKPWEFQFTFETETYRYISYKTKNVSFTSWSISMNVVDPNLFGEGRTSKEELDQMMIDEHVSETLTERQKRTFGIRPKNN